jgi:long-chain acyl-CoA synthetase
MVIGEQRPYLAALVVLSAEAWRRETAQLAEAEEASPSAQRRESLLLERIAKAVRGFPTHATPRAVWWTTEPWTIAGGLLTPTLKIKRPAMEQRFATQIATLYARKPKTRAPAGHVVANRP